MVASVPNANFAKELYDRVFEESLALLGGFFISRPFFLNSLLLVGYEARFAPSSRLDLKKNDSRILQRSYRSAH
jgi:hypothetical protein